MEIKEQLSVIWSNENLDFEDWKREFADEFEDMDESELRAEMYERNQDDALECERSNLDIELLEDIIIIADLGLWDGRKSAYKIVKERNLSACLYSEYDYTTWFVDHVGDLRCKDSHHDGTNYYLYRMFKPGTTDDQKSFLFHKICDKTATRQDITRLTLRLGDEVAEVYGFKIPGKKRVGIAAKK